MTTWFERTVSTLLCVSGVAIAASVIHREFWPPTPTPGGINPKAPPTFVGDVGRLKAAGITRGNPSAPIQIIEFADFECPYCAKYESILDSAVARHRDSVSVTFVHWPLDMHRNAVKAAQSAECAYEQDRFMEMKRRLYASQDSFSTQPWARLAKEAGVPDLDRFTSCMSRAGGFARVDSGRAIAKRMDFFGTPTVLINGWLYSGAPQDTAIESAIRSLSRGKNPRNAKK